MAYTGLVVALGAIIASSAAASTQPVDASGAPAGTPDTRYCMRIEPITGSRMETVRCWTRAEWAAQDVDVDHDWAKEGVRVINS